MPRGRDFQNLLLALNATPRLRYEVCETFYHKNKFRVELGHLRKFLGSASPLVAYTIGWDVAAWIRSIKVDIWWKRGKRPGQLAYELPRDALRATFAEAALTEDIYFPKVDE